MPSVGITRWIADCFLGGVPFTRKWAGVAAAKAPRQALSHGRRVDAHIKALALHGTPPPTASMGGKAAANAAAEMRRLGIVLNDANVFLTHGGIRTHVDAVGTINGRATVVVELKSTTRPLAAAKAVYDTPCRKQPVAGGLPNTERTHHQMQLGWTVMAYRATVKRAGVVGVIITAAPDGATHTMLDEAFAEPAFWRRSIAAAPPPMGVVAKTGGGGVGKWPGHAATVAVERATGANVRTIHEGRVALLRGGGGAVAVAKPLAKVSKAAVRRMNEAVAAAGAGCAWLVHPVGGEWQVSPMPAAKRCRV